MACSWSHEVLLMYKLLKEQEILSMNSMKADGKHFLND